MLVQKLPFAVNSGFGLRQQLSAWREFLPWHGALNHDHVALPRRERKGIGVGGLRQRGGGSPQSPAHTAADCPPGSPRATPRRFPRQEQRSHPRLRPRKPTRSSPRSQGSMRATRVIAIADPHGLKFAYPHPRGRAAPCDMQRALRRDIQRAQALPVLHCQQAAGTSKRKFRMRVLRRPAFAYPLRSRSAGLLRFRYVGAAFFGLSLMAMIGSACLFSGDDERDLTQAFPQAPETPAGTDAAAQMSASLALDERLLDISQAPQTALEAVQKFYALIAAERFEDAFRLVSLEARELITMEEFAQRYPRYLGRSHGS